MQQQKHWDSAAVLQEVRLDARVEEVHYKGPGKQRSLGKDIYISA